MHVSPHRIPNYRGDEHAHFRVENRKRARVLDERQSGQQEGYATPYAVDSAGSDTAEPHLR